MSHRYIEFRLLALVLVVVLSTTLPVQTNAQDYSQVFESTNATGWFGGDDITARSPRSVGAGQSVLIESNVNISSFSMFYKGPFDFVKNPDGFGHTVTLVLNVRDNTGAILQTSQTVLPDSFTADWVTWADLDVNVAANSTVNFTTYMTGAMDPATQYTASYAANNEQQYSNGTALGKQGTSDADMEVWAGWGPNGSWDALFRVSGTIVSGVATEDEVIRSFRLENNYPNPFNPTTTIAYTLPDSRHVQLRVYNVLGALVRTVVDGVQSPGQHSESFSARNLPSGVYFYKLDAGLFSETKRMVLLK